MLYFFDDPNSDNYGYGLEYKNKIVDLIIQNDLRYMFDIHGCANSHNFDIDIGTNNGKNCTDSILLNNIKEEFSMFDVKKDDIFKASKTNNISRYIHELTTINCLQFEISCKIREDEKNLNIFITCFIDLINKLSLLQ